MMTSKQKLIAIQPWLHVFCSFSHAGSHLWRNLQKNVAWHHFCLNKMRVLLFSLSTDPRSKNPSSREGCCAGNDFEIENKNLCSQIFRNLKRLPWICAFTTRLVCLGITAYGNPGLNRCSETRERKNSQKRKNCAIPKFWNLKCRRRRSVYVSALDSNELRFIFRPL